MDGACFVNLVMCMCFRSYEVVGLPWPLGFLSALAFEYETWRYEVSN